MASATNSARAAEGDTVVPEGRAEAAELMYQMAYFAVRHLSPRDLSMTTVSALGRLERLGPHRLTVLAASEGVAQPSMTQAIKRLEGQGLVTRTADPDDGRAVLVAITDRGRRLMADRRRARHRRLAQLLGELPPDEEEALTAALHAAHPALSRLARNAEEAAGRGDRGDRTDPAPH